jgi:hypothetical protein
MCLIVIVLITTSLITTQIHCTDVSFILRPIITLYGSNDLRIRATESILSLILKQGA